jgi:hypothetical protein
VTWLEILKGHKWDNMIQQMLNDEFPIHKDYVLYSRLMRDNKKMVDYYLEQGSRADKVRQKELFNLILGEMRRDNNFNYWMEDREHENKMLKAERKQWLIPHTVDEWYKHLENPESVRKFRKEWEEKKDWHPRKGSLTKAQDLLKQPKSTFIRMLANYSNKHLEGREKMMMMQPVMNKLNSSYDSLQDIIDEIKGRTIRAKKTTEISGAALQSKTKREEFLDMIQQSISTHEQHQLTEEEWLDFEEELEEYFEDYKAERDKKRAIIQVREYFGDPIINKIVPDLPDKKTHPYIHRLFQKGKFKTEEFETRFSSQFDKDYTANTITLDLAKKYITRYSEWTKIKFEGKKYPTGPLGLRKNGDASGKLVLRTLQQHTRGTSKNWTSKIFMELLDLSGDMDGLSQWQNLKRQVTEKFRVKEDALKDAYLEDSWRKSNDDKFTSSVERQFGIKPEVLQVTDIPEEEYKKRLRRRIDDNKEYVNEKGEKFRSGDTWKDHFKVKTEEIDIVVNSIKSTFVDFVGDMNAALREGDTTTYKQGVINALGDEEAEEYIKAIDELSNPSMNGFTHTGSAKVGVSGEQIVGYRLPTESRNVKSVLVEFIKDLYDVVENQGNPEGNWGVLKRRYLKYKVKNPGKDVDKKLEQLGSKDSPFKDIIKDFINPVQKVIAEFIYTVYLDDVNVQEMFKPKKGGTAVASKLSTTDYGLIELIRVLQYAQSLLTGMEDITTALINLVEELHEHKDLSQFEKEELLTSTKTPFLKEVRELTNALSESIPNIKQGVIDTVQANIIHRVVKNKERLKSTMPWILNDMVEQGFITEIKGEEE